MMKKLAVSAALCLLALTGFAGIEIQLEFSTDDGKTWGEDFPILKKENPRCKIRAKFQVSTDDEKEKIRGNVVFCSLYSKKNDFASANRGKQNSFGACWIQSPQKNYMGYKSKIPFVYDLDLGERKEGTMGVRNKRENNKMINAPLPACTALPPGSYKFFLSIEYRTVSGKGVKNTQPFDVVISER